MKKNYFFNLILSISNILFPIISFPYVSKMIGPSGVGKVQFITSYAQYFALIAALGIPVYGIREVAKAKIDRKQLDRVFSELVVIYFFTSMLLTVIYICTILFVPRLQHDPGLYLWSALLIVFSFTSVDWLYEGLEDFSTVAIRSMLIRVVSIVLMFMLIRSGNDSKWYLFIILFTTLANNAVNMFRLRKVVTVRFVGLSLKPHIRPLLLIFSTTIATSMYTMLDTVLLGFLANATSVGLYTAAVKLSKIALPIITSLGMVLVPGLAKDIASLRMQAAQYTLERSFAFTALLSIPIGIGLIVLAPEFIRAFSSDKFIEAKLSMQILAALPLLVGYGYFFGFQILVPGGRDKEMLLSVLGGVVMGLILNFTLVPVYKHVGAASANVISELTVTALYVYFVRRVYSFQFSVEPLVKALVSSLPFILVVPMVRQLELNVYLSLCIAVPVCGIVYFLIQRYVFRNRLIILTIQPYLISKYNSVLKQFTIKTTQIHG